MKTSNDTRMKAVLFITTCLVDTIKIQCINMPKKVSGASKDSNLKLGYSLLLQYS